MKKLTYTSYDDLKIGQSASYSKVLTEQNVALYGVCSGDINPVHFDEAFAADSLFKQRIGHGMWSAGLLSTVIGMKLPGPGSIYLGQELRFRNPVFIGDEVTATLTIKEKIEKRKWVVMSCEVLNQKGELILSGDATVLPPKVSGECEAVEAPDIAVAGFD